jgi:hypothetical protein
MSGEYDVIVRSATRPQTRAAADLACGGERFRRRTPIVERSPHSSFFTCRVR